MAIEITEEQRRNDLKEEYFFLQGQYEDYDSRTLQIKGWVSGGAIAALALAFQAKTKTAALALPVLTAFIVLVIWYLEAHWKVFQYAMADRIRIIEAYFRNDAEILVKNPIPFQVYHSWFESYVKDLPLFEYERLKYGRPRALSARLWAASRQTFVCLPYAVILVLCVVSMFSDARPRGAFVCPSVESGASQPGQVGSYSHMQRRGCKISFPRVAA